jgi:uncharacterized membrane protein YphA (DoxX/SURF4 family)
MQLTNHFEIPSLLLRIAIAVPYLWFVADRFGFLGAPGQPHVGWGNWKNFLDYASQVMSFIPQALVNILAVVATICELTFGLMLLLGIFTQAAAVGSGILSLFFAISMAISSGIESPFGYSVFTLSAASFLLATIPEYKWSVDYFIFHFSHTPSTGSG